MLLTIVSVLPRLRPASTLSISFGATIFGFAGDGFGMRETHPARVRFATGVGGGFGAAFCALGAAYATLTSSNGVGATSGTSSTEGIGASKLLTFWRRAASSA